MHFLNIKKILHIGSSNKFTQLVIMSLLGAERTEATGGTGYHCISSFCYRVSSTPDCIVDYTNFYKKTGQAKASGLLSGIAIGILSYMWLHYSDGLSFPTGAVQVNNSHWLPHFPLLRPSGPASAATYMSARQPLLWLLLPHLAPLTANKSPLITS